MQAVGLLLDQGYRDVRDFPGGMQEWEQAGEPVERGEPSLMSTLQRTPIAEPVAGRPVRRTMGWSLRSLADRSLVRLGAIPTGRLLLIWVSMIVLCGVLYWALDQAGIRSLHEGTKASTDPHSLLTALYFSFVTATSLGFGDVVPIGPARAIAIAEAAVALLLFGCVISKLVSTRQEQLLEQTHRLAWEERLGRVRSSLHLVFADLQGIRALHAGQEPSVVAARLESTAMVFAGELRIVHDLLHRSEFDAGEVALGGILSSLQLVMREMRDLVALLTSDIPVSDTLRQQLKTIARLGGEICGECVPLQYTSAMQSSMNQIQAAGHALEVQSAS